MFRLIATIDRKKGLAKQGVQPWYIPEDGQHFGELTKSLGGTVLMGDVTFKLIGSKALPDRHNYVLTRDKTPLEGVELVPDLEKFLDHWKGQDVWVIGGANVFTQIMSLKRADELYLTHIQADFGCNQFFPDYEDSFTLAEQSEMHEENGFIFTYARYLPRM